MQRRSFLSVLGITPLIRMPLWGQSTSNLETQEWGPPSLKTARAEHQRVVLSFAPVREAVSYIVRYRDAGGSTEAIKAVLATDYSVQGLQKSVSLDLARYESVFVVLNPSAKPEVYLQSSDADETVRNDKGEVLLRKYAPGTVRCLVAHSDGKIEEKRLVTPSRPLPTLVLREGWTRTPVEPNGALYKCRFNWPRDLDRSAGLGQPTPRECDD